VARLLVLLDLCCAAAQDLYEMSLTHLTSDAPPCAPGPVLCCRSGPVWDVADAARSRPRVEVHLRHGEQATQHNPAHGAGAWHPGC